MTALADAIAAEAKAHPTRIRILEVGEQLFRTFGYQRTTMADIARELGMSPANLYRYFTSKSALNEAIAERTLGGLAAELEAIVAGPGTAELRFRRFLDAKFRLCLTLFTDERRMHDMVSAAMAEHWDVVERFLTRVREALARLFAEAVEAGEFARLDPLPTARLVLDAVVCWTHPVLIETCIQQRGQSEDDMRAELGLMADFLLRTLRGPATS